MGAPFFGAPNQRKEGVEPEWYEHSGSATFIVIYSVNVDLQLLASEGKEFKWEKPSSCPHCVSGTLWGHGFVGAYFDGFAAMLFLKRYRCNTCHTTITLKPQGYWRKFQTSIQSIFAALSHRLTHCCWAHSIKRQRAGHWLRRFIRKVRMDFGLGNEGEDLMPRLKDLYQRQIHFLD